MGVAVKAAVAWLLLVPVGTVLLAAALVVGVPAMLLGLVGVWCWRVADRLLRRRLLTVEVGDDTLIMLAEHDAAMWRSYMAHPSAREDAARTVRGREGGDR